MTSFASDNYAPVHPEVMAALLAANVGPAASYGADPWTQEFDQRICEVFGANARAFPVLTGTGANVISLMSMTPRWGGVVTSEWAHIVTDENGAPERVGGLKLLPLDSRDGKIRPEALSSYAGDIGNVHRAQPVMLSVTQCTELGTVYSVDELQVLVSTAHDLGMNVHLDGSRIANAAVALNTDIGTLTTEIGVDVVSLGAAKNGGMLGEAVVIPDATHNVHAAHAIPFLRKATMQLGAKLRFVSAQLLALLGEGGTALSGASQTAATDNDPLWWRNARHSNAMAARLRARVDALADRGVRATQATQTNVVFAELPRVAADKLRAAFPFYDWADGSTPDRVEARWMCAWDTTTDDVDDFADALSNALS